HRRAVAIRARRLRIARRQGVPVHVVGPRAARTARRPAREPNHAEAAGACDRYYPAHRRDVRRDRVRDRQSEGQVGAGARPRADRAGPSGFSRATRTPGARVPAHSARVFLALGVGGIAEATDQLIGAGEAELAANLALDVAIV